VTGPGRVAANGNCVAIHMADRYNDPVPLTTAVARAFAARVLAAADSVDHSGVAGEPEATTENARCYKPAWVWLGSVAPPCGMPLDDRGRCSNPHPGSGPQIAVAATPTPVHPDTASDSAAAVLAGAATVSAETVEVFKAAIPEERHGWLPYDEEIRVGLAAAARLIAAQALRSAARTLRTQIGSSWGIGDAVVHLLRRADELERGADRG